MLFNGCAKKDISAPLLIAAKNQQEVIEQFLKIPENASDELKYLVNDIQKTEKEYHFLYAYVQRNGIPNWGAAESNIPIFKGVVTKTGNITSNSVANNSSNNSASAETYFIPLIDTVSKEVKSYIFCRKNIDGKINYKTYNKQAILSSTAKDSSDVKIKGVLLSVFAHFERKINNKNTLLLPFPYNYNFENMEIKFLSSQIGDANSISKNATSDGLIKKNDNVGCDFIIKITGTGNFLLAYGAVLTLHFNCNGIIFSWEVEGGGISSGSGGNSPTPSNPIPPSNPTPTPPAYNPPTYYPPYIPYFPYTPPSNNYQPGTGIGGGGVSGQTPFYGLPNNNYPPNWIEDPNNPWMSQGLLLDLIGMPGQNQITSFSPPYVNGEFDPDYYLNLIDANSKSKIVEYYNSIDHYWENSSYDNNFPPYDPNRDGQRDSDGFRKNGSVYHYTDGNVQNYSDDNGGKYAVFTKTNGEIIKFPGATITDFGVLNKSGVTTPNGGIRMSTNANGLVDLQHEYGHLLYANIIGSAAYFSKVVPFSLYSAFLSTLIGTSHQSNWTEKIANNLSAAYFGPNSPIAISTFYQK